jgi:dihydrofolate reductase
MIISLIVAMDEQRGIGINNRLPWHLSADLRMFKALTMGHHLIMGRKTFQSIGRALPGRRTIVVTRNPAYHPDGAVTAISLEDALALALEEGETEVFIVGGSEIFVQALPLADRIYLTQVHASTGADVFFPAYDPEDWTETRAYFQPSDAKNDHAFTFRQLERNRGV